MHLPVPRHRAEPQHLPRRERRPDVVQRVEGERRPPPRRRQLDHGAIDVAVLRADECGAVGEEQRPRQKEQPIVLETCAAARRVDTAAATTATSTSTTTIAAASPPSPSTAASTTTTTTTTGNPTARGATTNARPSSTARRQLLEDPLRALRRLARVGGGEARPRRAPQRRGSDAEETGVRGEAALDRVVVGHVEHALGPRHRRDAPPPKLEALGRHAPRCARVYVCVRVSTGEHVNNA